MGPFVEGFTEDGFRGEDTFGWLMAATKIPILLLRQMVICITEAFRVCCVFEWGMPVFFNGIEKANIS